MTSWSFLTRILPVMLAVSLTACVSSTPSKSPAPAPASTASGTGSSRYSIDKDIPVLEPFDITQVREVIPKVEVRTLAGNKSPYTINGSSYRVMESEEGYTDTGMASWYGRKFHGHLTSNGEIYDMFQLTAAHKTMPIPSYVRVTNLDNGRSVVARVNDRGPFHDGRVIDMSYAGAVILGYANTGTARVRVEAIMPPGQQSRQQAQQIARAPVPAQPGVLSLDTSLTDSVATERQLIEEDRGQEYLQIGAFGNIASARTLVTRLGGMTALPVFIKSEVGDNGIELHKVRVGPLSGAAQTQSLIDSVQNAQLGTPFRVRI